MKRFVWLLALALLLTGGSASARSSAYQSFNVAGRGGARWQNFSPTWIAGVFVWLRADLGVTSLIGPVTATGTVPPTVTLAGAPSTTQTAATTPYVELDCTLGGALGVAQFTAKVNGVTTMTAQPTSASVAITGSGVTASWAAGVSTNNDVYKSNVVASAIADQSGLVHNGSQATASSRPTVAFSTSYAGQQVLSFASASSQSMSSSAFTVAQPMFEYVVGNLDSSANNQSFFDWQTTETTIYNGASAVAIVAYAGASLVGTTSSPATPAMYMATFNGASSQIFKNNSQTPLATGNASTGPAVGGYVLGGLRGPSAFLNGTIEEVVIAGSVSSDQRWRLAVYANNRTGVPAN